MQTQALAKFVANLSYDQLPAATRQMAKQCILDALACCTRGSEEQPSKLMQKVIGLQQGKAEATIFCARPWRTTALNAALVNGASTHALDMDDLHNASIIHLGTVVVPAALALAEQLGANGQQLITAVVAGYEVGARIGEAVNPDSYFFWHTTGTAGTFGAAAAAAKLLDLTAEQTAHCLGSAGTQAAGLWEFLESGGMSKTLHAGKGAANGVLSGLLAKEGFTGATTILEGKKGFCHAMTNQPKLARLTANLGAGLYKIDENSFKPYACCKHCHAANNAAQLLCSKHQILPEQVTAITIKTNSVADNLVNNPAPQNTYGSKFSLQYCVAAAIRFGQVGVDEFSPAAAQDSELRRLMQLVAVVVDPQLEAEYQRHPAKWSAIVTIETARGQIYQEMIAYPKGDPQNPVSYHETEEKCRTLASSVFSPTVVERLLQTVGTIETEQDLSRTFTRLTN